MKTLVVPARSLVLVFAGAKHEFFNRFAGVLAFVENHFHLLGDGHLNAVLAGQSESSARSQHSFRRTAAATTEREPPVTSGTVNRALPDSTGNAAWVPVPAAPGAGCRAFCRADRKSTRL